MLVKKKLIQLMPKYLFFGLLAVCIELTSFFLLIKYFNYILANSISYGSCIMVSFTLNKIFNFKTKDKSIIRFGRFLLVNISGLIISNLFLLIFNGLMPYFELKIISMPFVITFQFLMNYFWTFRRI